MFAERLMGANQGIRMGQEPQGSVHFLSAAALPVLQDSGCLSPFSLW